MYYIQGGLYLWTQCHLLDLIHHYWNITKHCALINASSLCFFFPSKKNEFLLLYTLCSVSNFRSLLITLSTYFCFHINDFLFFKFKHPRQTQRKENNVFPYLCNFLFWPWFQIFSIKPVLLNFTLISHFIWRKLLFLCSCSSSCLHAAVYYSHYKSWICFCFGCEISNELV